MDLFNWVVIEPQRTSEEAPQGAPQLLVCIMWKHVMASMVILHDVKLCIIIILDAIYKKNNLIVYHEYFPDGKRS
jgi:hypothetical protein